MKKIISIGVALALLTMAVVPGVVAADDPPPTFAKIPFTIVGEGINLIGSLVAMADSKLGLGLGFDVSQFTTPIAEYVQGPLGYTMDMMGWGLDIMVQALDVILPEFMPDFAWLGEVLGDIVCKIFTPFAAVVAPPFDPCG